MSERYPDDGEDMLNICMETRIDLLWDTLTDEDKVAFAEMVRDAAAEKRAILARVDAQ